MDFIDEYIKEAREILKDYGIEEKKNWSLEDGCLINWDEDIEEGVWIKIGLTRKKI